jgi:1,3-beta-glucan synthase
MFAADFVLGHWLLFIMMPLVTFPKMDMIHSIMLFWLRPRFVQPPLMVYIPY